MTRVAVIGNAAAGRSTPCRQQGHARKLPYFLVDKMQWLPGWQLVPEGEFAAKHAVVLSQRAWIIDGLGLWEEVQKRFDLVDTILFMDHPRWLHYWRATKRQIKLIFRARQDGPAAISAWNHSAQQ